MNLNNILSAAFRVLIAKQSSDWSKSTNKHTQAQIFWKEI